MTDFWKPHSIKQVSPQHPDHSDAKAASKSTRDKSKQSKLFNKLEGQAPSLGSNSMDASLKHEGY